MEAGVYRRPHSCPAKATLSPSLPQTYGLTVTRERQSATWRVALVFLLWGQAIPYAQNIDFSSPLSHLILRNYSYQLGHILVLGVEQIAPEWQDAEVS